MNNINDSQGIIYLAFGKKYADEAQRSLKSLRKVSSIPTCVITNQPWTSEPRPDHFVLREELRSFRSKPLYIYEASPFQNTLFLDTDTIIAKDVHPIFDLLKWYDIGVCFGGAQLNHPNGLEFHSQCNSGVILFRKCDDVRSLMQNWLRIYDMATEKVKIRDRRGLGDQRYLAIAIAESKARPVHLGSFLNFALFDNITTCSPPIVYHGRAPWIELLADDINQTWHQEEDWFSRVWLPNISGFLPRGIRRSDPILATALLFRRICNNLKWRFKRL